MRLFLLAAVWVLTAAADDGIWLFNQFPKQRVKDTYKFDVTDGFLDRIRGASVRLNNGGSGSFVSARGLIFTNHHVASDCIQKLSSAEHNYMDNGFHAVKEAEEKACPDLEINVLQAIEDVTEKVQPSAAAGISDAEANQRRKARMTEIEKECGDRTGQRCDVVTLFSGGAYHLYRYKKYTDIRLVFAPEVSIAAFGGDPDNFTYPRYCLDFTFLRAYENGKPLATPNHLAWSKTGVRDGELTFVSGHPGSTGRLATLSQLEYFRDFSYPLLHKYLKSIIDALLKLSATGEENRRIARDNLFSQQNSFKAYTGFLGGLRDPELMARKRDEEKNLLAGLKEQAARTELEATLREIAAAYEKQKSLYRDLSLLETAAVRGSDLFHIARDVYRYGIEKAKPNAQRLREYVDPALPSLEQGMYSDAPLYPQMEITAIRNYLEFVSGEYGANHAIVKRLLDGRTAQEAAARYVGTSKLIDVAERKRLAGDPAAADTSTDGMLVLVRAIDTEARAVRKQFEDNVEAVITSAASRIAKARFAVYGTSAYPDATFTLRLSYGPVKAYGSHPYTTQFGGVFGRATGKDPFALPPSWLKAKSKLNLKTPFNFVTTCDTHGGNSGSPTINTKGEVIGILFDGNLEGLPNRFVYRDQTERSVHVASQAIVESLEKVYGARRIVAELGLK